MRALAIVGVAGVTTLTVFNLSAAGAWQSADPRQAIARAPWDAGVNANMSALLLSVGRTGEARLLAEAALGREPVNVVALRTLGRIADEEGEQDRALLLIERAQRLSRRDQPTQLWLISRDLRNAEFAGAIRNFDIALRTSGRSWGSLLPLLAGATADSRILAPLLDQLEQEPRWKVNFLQTLATTGPRLDHAVALSRGRLDPAVPRERAVIDRLLARLTQAREFDLAWQLHRELSADLQVEAGNVRDGGFEAISGFGPFDWMVATGSDLAAMRQARPDGEGHALGLVAYNNRTGEVARQLLRLSPGRYRLELEMGAIPATPFERPTLRLACAEAQDGGDFLSFRPEDAGEEARRVGGVFTVPAGCRWQWLLISIAGGDGAARDDTPWIDNIAIESIS